MIKRVLNSKVQQTLKDIETIRKKPNGQLTMDDIKKIVIFIATKQGILK